MRTLCFGGSFNPIHHGHVICARAVAEAKGFERVLLIPNAQSPLKPNDSDWATGEHRLRMCEIAIEGDSLFEVSDLELRRPPPSYTIDTVRELKRSRGWDEVNWLIGLDILEEFGHWHEPEALLIETNFVVMRRPGAVTRRMSDVVETPQIEISATDIRRRVRERRSIKYLTPLAVCEYIRSNGLYF